MQHVMENGPTALMPITIGRTFLYGRGSCDGTEQCDLQRTEPVSTGTRGEIRLCDRRKKCRLYPARQKATAPVYLCRYGIAHGAMQKACTGAGTFTDKELRRHIQDVDKRRSKYYQFFTGQTWGEKLNYDLCINTSGANIEDLVKVIAKLVK